MDTTHARPRRADRYKLDAQTLMARLAAVQISDADRYTLLTIVGGVVDEMVAENASARPALRGWQREVMRAGGPAKTIVL